ncbi:MAG: hypothetical protein FWD60_03550 [Candidatus Azobacteroides sp.]|nr:hypothetical protein [Candidatus Azobacteroides sp.]
MKLKNLSYLIVLLLFSNQMLKAQLETCKLVITDGVQNASLKQTIEKNVSEFITSCNAAVIKGGQPNLNKQATTESARKSFLAIWNTSPLGCSVSTLERKCLIRSAGGYQIRDIPVTMLDAPENEQNQEVVINLTADGKIDDIIIPVTQYADLLYRSIDAEDISLRTVVLDFVENFRTSYNTKNLKYLGTLFSDNAIIIVGKELKEIKQPKSDMAQNNLPSDKRKMFEFRVKTKKEYLASLSETFSRNKYIDVRFDSIQVVRDPDPNNPVYGVTLRQDWKSSTYMDTGYVFLLIDFSDKIHPVITVRTWQPEKYQGRNLRRDEIFQLRDFY